MSSPEPSPSNPQRQPWVRSSVGQSWIVGVLVAGLVLAPGFAFLAGRTPAWSASASMVVLPARQADPLATAGYYETLSRGQIVATFAEMLRLRRFETSGGERLGLSAAQLREISVSVEVVPDTALIVVSASAPQAAVAEGMADGIVAAWTPFVDEISTPFSPAVVSPAAGTAERLGANRPQLGAVLVFVALVAGFSAQQALLQLAGLFGHRREGGGRGGTPDGGTSISPAHPDAATDERLYGPMVEPGGEPGGRDGSTVGAERMTDPSRR